MGERGWWRGFFHGASLVLLVAPLLYVGSIALVSSGILGFGGPEPRPPRGTLAYGNKTEVGFSTIGCWSEKRRFLPDNSACVYSEAGVSPREPRLRVPEGERMEFVYGGPSAPEEIGARAYRTDVPPNLDSSAQGYEPPPREGAHLGPAGYAEERLAVEQMGERAGINADLPPGRYLLIVSVRVDDETAEGEAFYHFEVAVG